jgi:hypothetical protein
MDEGVIATALSVLMMGVAAVRLVWWIATYRWLLIGVLTAWSLWLAHAVAFASGHVSETLDDIFRRAEAVSTALVPSHLFVGACSVLSLTCTPSSHLAIAFRVHAHVRD